MLGLQVEKVTPPNFNLIPSENLKQMLNNFDLNKVVCFSPEANSCNLITQEFWEILAKKLNKLGYKIIINITNENNYIKGTLNLQCSLSDFIYIASKCKASFSIRSGLSDILSAVSQNCYVFSTEEIFKDYFLMNKCYNLSHQVYEYKINTKTISYI